MELFNRSTPLKLTVRPSAIKEVKRGHPWVYKQSLLELPPAQAGSFAVLRDKKNNIFAKGFYHSNSNIAFRVCALEEQFSSKLIEAKIDEALSVRSSLLLDDSTSGLRLLNGEGDKLPGLVCDKYGDVAVLQCDGEGAEKFWTLEHIAELLKQKLSLQSVYFKPRTGSTQQGRTLAGKEVSQPVEFLEHGMKFTVDVINGQKSGFFLDQRENRKLIRNMSEGKKVLNLFSYTGGFSLAAAFGGAMHVTSVDIAKPAIEFANKHIVLNGLPESMHAGYAANAFDFIDSCNQRFDIVIIDPPAFVSSKDQLEKGLRAYKKIFLAALNLCAPGACVALSSCSRHVNPEMFMELCKEVLQGRRAQVLGVYGQPFDHPYVLACEELRYLKFNLFRL